jgi:hypothetical protein
LGISRELKKAFEKICPEGLKVLSLPSARDKKGIKKKKQFFFRNPCLIKKKLYFCTRFERQANKKRRHVHRHIGLTALQTAMSGEAENKKEEELEFTLRFWHRTVVQY